MADRVVRRSNAKEPFQEISRTDEHERTKALIHELSRQLRRRHPWNPHGQEWKRELAPEAERILKHLNLIP